MSSLLSDKSSNDPRLMYAFPALVDGWRALFLYLILALIIPIASTNVGGEARLWQLHDSVPVTSYLENLAVTGHSNTGSSVLPIPGQLDQNDRTRNLPIDETSYEYSHSDNKSGDEVSQAASNLPTLEEFRQVVMNGHADQLTGIWVKDVLAFRVQPGLTSYAPASKDTLSIYNWAWKHGVVGMMIHDYRGGTLLYQLNPGVQIAAIYGNGGVDWYVSRGGTWYESRFGSSGGFSGPFRIWSCDTCSFDVSGRELHDRHYSGANRLAFQTCVYAEGRVGLVIVEAYLDWPPEPQRTGGDSEEIWERSYLGLRGELQVLE